MERDDFWRKYRLFTIEENIFRVHSEAGNASSRNEVSRVLRFSEFPKLIHLNLKKPRSYCQVIEDDKLENPRHAHDQSLNGTWTRVFCNREQ